MDSGTGDLDLGVTSGPSMGDLLANLAGPGPKVLPSKTRAIKMKELPFYDIRELLLPPHVLVNQKEKTSEEELAYFQKSVAITRAHYVNIMQSCKRESTSGRSSLVPTLQFQLRFCAIDPASEEQVDMLPPGLQVKVNERYVSLPNFAPKTNPKVEPKRLPEPIDITVVSMHTFTIAKPVSSITVEWKEDGSGQDYAMAIFLVKRLTAKDLFQRLIYQAREATIEQVKKITSAIEDGVSAPKFVRVSMMCPLGKARMKYPCRAVTCSHLQCFDAEMFLRMNEVKSKFKCPVCNANLKFDDLRLDNYTICALHSFPNMEFLELYPNGGCRAVIEIGKIENAVIPQRKRMHGGESSKDAPTAAPGRKIICISLEEESHSASQTPKESGASVDPPVIDIADSDDDESDDTIKGTVNDEAETNLTSKAMAPLTRLR